jgi:hypothetical protein
MSDFHWRLLLRADLTKAQVDPRKMLTGAHREALAWIESNTPHGAVVLDIGVGPGYFLKALRMQGFRPMGLDVAEEPLKSLREEGYHVWHGTIDTIPANWPEPTVCSMFFALHHLPDPVAFLRNIRTKFPDAVLITAESNGLSQLLSSRRIPSPAWLPPRNLGFWGPKSLRKAMELAGYKVEKDTGIAMTTSDYVIPGSNALYLTQLLRTCYLMFRTCLQRWLPTYYAARTVLFKPGAFLDRLRGKTPSIVCIGQPV